MKKACLAIVLIAMLATAFATTAVEKKETTLISILTRLSEVEVTEQK